MKKLSWLIGVLMLVFATVPAARAADFCVSFEPGGFCDALELNWTPGSPALNGTWKNYDCLGTAAPVSGGIQQGGNAIVLCLDSGVCPLGLTWIFQLEFTSSVFNLIRWDGVNPVLHQYQQPFSLLPGACPMNARSAGEASTSQ